ncbi:hypothetical protein BC938DRAFT_482394 [Jimgerdemannia flammicorona]|uniref:Uncharacterized protein n=1 Tax=Jimgerdemannia flammicorona TaxID=994334 RepID=A0A433QE51_9FUNG|nr:hypothetical protein BC938DRAFT_482394 [Jimgerdemannia flammicorona]
MNKYVLDLLLGRLIDKLLVEGDDALRESLTDSVNLARVTWWDKVQILSTAYVAHICPNHLYNRSQIILLTTTLDANSDVNVSEALLAEKEDGLVYLKLQNLGLEKLNRRAVHANETLSALDVSDGCGGFLCNKNGNNRRYVSAPFFSG